MSNKKAIHSEHAPAAIGPYSQAVQAGNLVFLSGQIPLLPDTMEVIDGDFEARARQVFTNLKAVAEAAGGSLDDVVKVTDHFFWSTLTLPSRRCSSRYIGRLYPS